jgi:hypothetical protein
MSKATSGSDAAISSNCDFVGSVDLIVITRFSYSNSASPILVLNSLDGAAVWQALQAISTHSYAQLRAYAWD